MSNASGVLHVLCVDPGKISGVSTLRHDPAAAAESAVQVVHSDELEEYATGDHVNAVLTAARAAGDDVVVVVEDFVTSMRTLKASRADWSLHLIGVTRWLCHAHGYPPPVMQGAGEAKGFCPNERLRTLGLWHVGGGGHARDALRHGVTFLVHQRGWRPSGLLTG